MILSCLLWSGASSHVCSFGILLYEMMGFRTPFYEKNRKLMFHGSTNCERTYSCMCLGIINCEPAFPPHFTSAAQDVLRELLQKDPIRRLGSKGADDLKAVAFFSMIDFNLLARKELVPPFKPDVSDESDTKYVPKSYLQAKPEDSIDASVRYVCFIS